jgi:hypothetical protein
VDKFFLIFENQPSNEEMATIVGDEVIHNRLGITFEDADCRCVEKARIP